MHEADVPIKSHHESYALQYLPNAKEPSLRKGHPATHPTPFTPFPSSFIASKGIVFKIPMRTPTVTSRFPYQTEHSIPSLGPAPWPAP